MNAALLFGDRSARLAHVEFPAILGQRFPAKERIARFSQTVRFLVVFS